jgi:hypothetical protein
MGRTTDQHAAWPATPRGSSPVGISAGRREHAATAYIRAERYEAPRTDHERFWQEVCADPRRASGTWGAAKPCPNPPLVGAGAAGRP